MKIKHKIIHISFFRNHEYSLLNFFLKLNKNLWIDLKESLRFIMSIYRFNMPVYYKLGLIFYLAQYDFFCIFLVQFGKWIK